MANDKITMLKLKRMLQLLDAGKSMNDICRDLHMSKRTVHNYKQRVTSSNVPLAELRRLDDKQLNQLLQPQSPVPKPDERKEALDKELSNYLKEWNKPYVSILLLWEEYRKAYPNGYQYTQFKKYLNEYKKSHEYSYHNVYIPGEEMQIDYAGDKLYIRDKSSGIWVEVVVLCCVMPYSSKAFAMGAFDSTQENLFHCLSRCMSYFGRVPKVAKSDNMVQWVKHGSQYERPFTESTDEQGQTVWDSGRITSSTSLAVPYAGTVLRPETHYQWTVEVWNQQGEKQMATSWFETSLMETSDKAAAWAGARWIGGDLSAMPFYSAYQSVFRICYKVEMEQRAALIFGANDPRLMDANKNILGQQNQKDQSYIKVELAYGDSAVLHVYRVGYTQQDRADQPLQSLGVPRSLINEANRKQPHAVEIAANSGRTTLSVDGEKVGDVLLNPMGNSGDYICFPVLGDMGFEVPQGGTVPYLLG